MLTTPITWRMWYGREEVSLTWPKGWNVHVCPMDDAPEMGDAEIAGALARPVAGPTLQELAAGKNSCCILVDDLTRPTPAARVLPPLIELLAAAGLCRDEIFLIVANGTHRALTRIDLEKKVGATVCENHLVLRHDCHQNLVRIADIPGVGPIEVNRFFHEADLKIGISGLMPHFGAGFSGGSKIVMPAVCGFETIANTHGHALDGPPAAVGVVAGNRMREIMDECARMARLHFSADCVFDARGDLAALHCGEPIGTFAAAARHARSAYAIDVPYGSDVAVFNAFPKDTEFIQAMASLNVWADRGNPARDLVRPGGTIVVICAASEGLGTHELIECGRLQFRRRDRHGSFKHILGGRNLLFLAPGVSPVTVRQYYQPEARHFADWPSLRTALEELHPRGAHVTVFPSSALQLDGAFLAARPAADS